MLQQTRVETVVPYFERFLARLPSFEALASAPTDEVLALWAGLGYYRRAANLQKCAQAVLARHDGRLPRGEEELLSLPGIGAYTAGAIRSIAFGEPAPILDGNVVRVLSRLFRIEDGLCVAKPRLWEIAAKLVAGSRPSHLNQGLMELGATICTPRAPRCELCPIAKACDACSHADPERFPSGKVETRVRRMRLDFAWIERAGLVLLVRRPAHGLWANLWDLPSCESPCEPSPASDDVARRLSTDLGLQVTLGGPLVQREHVLTHRRVEAHVWFANVAADGVGEGRFDAHSWVAPDAAPVQGTSTLFRKIWKDVQEARRRPDLDPGEISRFSPPTRRGSGRAGSRTPARAAPRRETRR